jgi:hypothetical protein
MVKKAEVIGHLGLHHLQELLDISSLAHQSPHLLVHLGGERRLHLPSSLINVVLDDLRVLFQIWSLKKGGELLRLHALRGLHLLQSTQQKTQQSQLFGLQL